MDLTFGWKQLDGNGYMCTSTQFGINLNALFHYGTSVS